VKLSSRFRPLPPSCSAFGGFRFPAEVIVLARWYLRYGLSYRDVEELLSSAVSRSITSPCTGGCSGSRHCSRTRLAVARLVVGPHILAALALSSGRSMCLSARTGVGC
jgi:hypothetical protein